MTGSYTISIDRTRGLLTIILGGFFSLDEVSDLRRDRDAALAELGMPSNTHVTICDVAACKIQAQDIFAQFAALLAETGVAARRLAIVTGTSPAKMQVRRLISRPSLSFFDTRAQAEAWLFEERAAA